MASARQLFELQELDNQGDALKGRIEIVESQLGESEALRQARAIVQELDEQLSKAGGEERGLEWEVQDLKAKMNKVEQTLYGGSVHNPKELEALQKDLVQLRASQKAKEDKLLGLMERLEALQEEKKGAAMDLEKVEERWHGEQDALYKEEQTLRKQRAALEQTREGLVALVEAPVLGLYESLRSSRQGQAVSKVEGGMCRGCRISLPNMQVQLARRGQELVQCNSCGRIIYVG